MLRKLLFTGLIIAGLASAKAQNLSDSLLLYFPFTGNAIDQANGIIGTEHGGVSLTMDRLGNPNSAYEFDGVDDYISFPHKDEYKKALPLTLSMWVWMDDSSVTNQIFKTDNHPSTYYGINMNTISGNIGGSYMNGVAAGSQYRESVQASQLALSNSWHHYVIIFKGNADIDLYIDGALDASAFVSGTGDSLVYSTTDGAIGYSLNQFGGSDYYFDGKVDDIMLWNRVLTATEVYRLYTSQLDVVLDISMDKNANDNTIFQNHGIEAGGIGFTKDRFGTDSSAYLFDGVDDFISVPHDTNYKVSFPFTYSAWLRTDSLYSMPIFLSDDHVSKYTGAWFNFMPTGVLNAGLGTGTGAGSQYRKSVESGDSVMVSKWNQVVVVYNSLSDIKIYVNGVLDQTTVLSGTGSSFQYGTGPAQIGHSSDPFNPDIFYKGALDEVRIFSWGFDSADVADHFIPGVYFSQQPSSASIDMGMDVTFTAQAMGTGGDLSYQWQKKSGASWGDLSGETSSTLSFTSVETANGGSYRCVATSFTAEAFSNTVNLTIKDTTNTAIAVLENLDLFVYPNPNSGKFILETPGLVGKKASYTLYNSVGTVVADGKLNGQQTNVDVTYLPQGVYMVRMVSEANGLGTVRKILIE